MSVIRLHDLPVYSSTEGDLETVRFRRLFDQNMNHNYYILELKDLITNKLYMVKVIGGNVFTRLESERNGSNPRKFKIKRVLIPENRNIVICINDDHDFISLG